MQSINDTWDNLGDSEKFNAVIKALSIGLKSLF
jgi:hypothetical protein